MPKALVWTQKDDDTIRLMRSNGATWCDIGKALGMSRNTVIERGRRINATLSTAPDKLAKPLDERPAYCGALPPGSAATWGLICKYEFPKR